MIGFRQPMPGGVAARDACIGLAAMDVALPPRRVLTGRLLSLGVY
jgi:hypothetical protein